MDSTACSTPLSRSAAPRRGSGATSSARFALAPLLEDLAEVYGPLAEDEGFTISVDAPPTSTFSPIAKCCCPVEPDRQRAEICGRRIDDQAGGRPGGQHDSPCRRRRRPWHRRRADRRGGKRFVRLDPARAGPGAGLGLSLVETIAHLHGGTMVIGRADPHGMVVTLRLPIASS
jgi:signal transduction histidine kinase